jgi:hypothetical protein
MSEQWIKNHLRQSFAFAYSIYVWEILLKVKEEVISAILKDMDVRNGLNARKILARRLSLQYNQCTLIYG